MTETKFGKYIITELIREPTPPDFHRGESDPKEGTSLLRIDNKTLEGAFFFGSKWFWPVTIPDIPLADRSVGIIPHRHDWDEVLALFGSNWEDPGDLGGELELWLEGEKHIITKSCLIYLPKGLQHGPIGFNRIDRPIFHSQFGNDQLDFDQSMIAEKKYGEYIITQLKPDPDSPVWHMRDVKPGQSVEVLRLDSRVMKGDLFIGAKWLLPGVIPDVPLADRSGGMKSRQHDYDEILAFFGTDREDPYNLCGELEIWLDDEKHVITKNCAIYIPKGMKHGPVGFNRIDNPIFYNVSGRTKI